MEQMVKPALARKRDEMSVHLISESGIVLGIWPRMHDDLSILVDAAITQRLKLLASEAI